MSVFTPNIVNENGEQFIPATQRPDGTWRKARRVKDGYVPQEEVPLYESKGKQFVNKYQAPITLPSGQLANRPIPGLVILQNDSDKKPAKKKSKKKNEEISERIESLSITDNLKLEPSQKSEKKNGVQPESNKSSDTTDPQKKLKNLKKRLREVEALEEKLKNGLIEKPEPEQLVKIKRKGDLIVQIYELEKQMR